MKCINQKCGSPLADEINISLNISETAETEETEYTGTTDYGDPSQMIGTYCEVCGEATYVSNWREVVSNFIGVPEEVTA